MDGVDKSLEQDLDTWVRRRCVDTAVYHIKLGFDVLCLDLGYCLSDVCPHDFAYLCSCFRGAVVCKKI